MEQDDLSKIKNAKVILSHDKNLIIDVDASKNQPYLKIPLSYLKNKDKVTFKGIKANQKKSILIDNSQSQTKKLEIDFKVAAIGLSEVEMENQLNWIFIKQSEEEVVFKTKLFGKVSFVDVPKAKSQKTNKNNLTQERKENKKDLISNKNILRAYGLNESQEVIKSRSKLPVQDEESIVGIGGTSEIEIEKPSASTDETKETANPEQGGTSSSEGQEKPTESTSDEDKRGSIITIYCLDEADEDLRLKGAVFTIFDAEDKVIQDDLITSETGYIASQKLKEGNYYLKQKKTSKGYLFDQSQKYDFKIESNKMHQIFVTNTRQTDGEIPQETELGTITIVKVNEQNQEEYLSGAEFLIYKKNDELYADQGIITDSEGKVTLAKIPFGDYYLLEKKAPRGYILNKEKYYFTINEKNQETDLEKIIVPGLKETEASSDSSEANSGATGKTSTSIPVNEESTATTNQPISSKSNKGSSNNGGSSRSEGHYYDVSGGGKTNTPASGNIKYLPETGEDADVGLVIAGLIVFSIVPLIGYIRMCKR